MEVYVPFDATAPKRRLESVLSSDERQAFARTMLRDVLDAITGAGLSPTVLSTGPVAVDVPVTIDERDLTPAVNDRLASASGVVAVVMADLPLVTPATVERLVDTPGDVVLVPGLGGGTNAVVARDPTFRVDYHGGSIRDHRAIARRQDLTVGTVDSYRLSVDVDEPPDLVEVLLHTDGHSAEWLSDHGFRVEPDTAGRVAVTRGPQG